MNKRIDIHDRLLKFAIRVVNICKILAKNFENRTISDQLIRSATSVGANMQEADAASSKKDFINFFTHSLKSANESKVWLALLRDTGKGDLEELKWLLNELGEIANVLASSILTLKGKR